jgi:hypothetical protein
MAKFAFQHIMAVTKLAEHLADFGVVDRAFVIIRQ